MTHPHSLSTKRLNIKDISDKSDTTSVIHVQDAMVQDSIDRGIPAHLAAQDAIKRIQDRTGKSFDKQFKIKVD